MTAIRAASTSDVESMVLVDSIAPSDKGRRARIGSWVASGEAVVAETDGRVVGYAVLEYSFFGQSFISMLQVGESNRRQGVASQLLTHLADMCRTGKLFTSTNESNAPMRALMDASGFEPSGVVHNLDDGDPELFFFKRVR